MKDMSTQMSELQGTVAKIISEGGGGSGGGGGGGGGGATGDGKDRPLLAGPAHTFGPGSVESAQFFLAQIDEARRLRGNSTAAPNDAEEAAKAAYEALLRRRSECCCMSRKTTSRRAQH